ncbi:GyrI-like domain-containing protein [Saccharibacillus sp. CPCC 101409]|uniref:GyrI-like domain-containing protein n=1 Tax=Saccharibacillus sp. CPCC 101409 TaxID=3058041 RepID=UPI002671085D|nr:GyrI-like domain-containing protein [Saccharibacillus sp. CPCC 101409]MDO3409849.1 GyrI-like domain-containing protein [Saccharibacillus sp. CPCC 101409]
MNYRIEEKGGMEMFGRVTEIGNIGEQPFEQIPDFWMQCIGDGTVDRIRAAAGLPANGQIHAVLYHKQEDRMSYLIGYMPPPGGAPEEFDRLSVPPRTYAIFSTGTYPDGQSDIHSLWKRIWSEWFPTSDYESLNEPEFEMTYDREDGLYEMEIWIPVRRRIAD